MINEDWWTFGMLESKLYSTHPLLNIFVSTVDTVYVQIMAIPVKSVCDKNNNWIKYPFFAYF